MSTATPAVRQLVPRQVTVPVRDIVARLNTARPPAPFAPELLAFGASLAGRLRREAGGRPELQALAYWMRGSALRKLAADHAALGSDQVMLGRRGTILHIPPSHVDTMFVYPWLLSTMVGNRNIVRLSPHLGEHTAHIVEVLRDVLAADGFEGIQASTAMVQYDHDASVTDELSAACDLRVIWGGDATVHAVRASPLPAHATDLTFPDRFSLAAVHAESYLMLAAPARTQLVERFGNDAYPFGQLACSSPRVVVWIGGPTKAAEAATDFFDRLAPIAQRYPVPAATALAKMGYAHRAAIDWPVVGIDLYGSALTVLRLDEYPPMHDEFCGAGTFLSLRLGSLADLVPHVRRRDQTLAQYGFDRPAVLDFVAALDGRGIDRIVPIGEALSFHRIWDGRDLLQAFTRRTTLELMEAHLT
jgi:hypothetical protein